MKCPHCGHGASNQTWTLPDRLFRTTDERFDVHRCAGCGIRFLWPVPPFEQLARYYPQGYWTGERDRATEAYRRFMLRDHARFVRGIAARQRANGVQPRLLDIGCGDGSVLDAIGIERSIGLDDSLGALGALRARGFAGVRASVLQLPFAPATFSIVSMFHFLEHVSPAEPFLRSAQRVLAPGGSLVVQVPNMRSIQAMLLGRHWAGYDVPRHLVDYTPCHLCEAVERAGFDVVQITQKSIRDNPTTLVNSLFPSLYPPARAQRSRLSDLTYLALVGLALPFTLLETLLGMAATVMVEARPRQSSS